MPSDAKEKTPNEAPKETTIFDSLFSAFGSLSCLSQMDGEFNLEMDIDQWNELKSSNIAYLTIFDNDM